MAGSFDAYVQELADPARQIALSKLVKLSKMQPDQASLFANAWYEMELRRRQRLIQELIDLTEDNVELNFDAVFLIALGDRDPDVRRNAIKGIWEHAGRGLIDALIGLLENDSDAGVRAEAAIALGRFVLQAELDSLRSADVDRVEAALRRVIDNADEVAEVRGRALEGLGARSEPWVSDLIRQAFESHDRRLWLSAVHAMGRSCDPAWLPALFAAAESDDPEMRYEAAVAFGSIADETATPHLLLLVDDDDDEVRSAAIDALGQIGGKEARATLEGLVEQDDERTREAALAALAEVDFADDPLSLKLRD
jgi:HEAT repeat protein